MQENARVGFSSMCCGCHQICDDQCEPCACGNRLHVYCKPSCCPPCAVCVTEHVRDGAMCPSCETPFHESCCTKPSDKDTHPCNHCGGLQRQPFVSRAKKRKCTTPAAKWCTTYLKKVCPVCNVEAARGRTRKCPSCHRTYAGDMFDSDDGGDKFSPRGECGSCQNWDLMDLVTLLATHVPRRNICHAVLRTHQGTAAHELALRVAASQGGDSQFSMPIPLGNTTCQSWLNDYLRAAQTQLRVRCVSGVLDFGNMFASEPITVVPFRGSMFRVVPCEKKVGPERNNDAIPRNRHRFHQPTLPLLSPAVAGEQELHRKAQYPRG